MLGTAAVAGWLNIGRHILKSAGSIPSDRFPGAVVITSAIGSNCGFLVVVESGNCGVLGVIASGNCGLLGVIASGDCGLLVAIAGCWW